MNLSIIGENIKYYRKKKHLTQEVLAERTQFSTNYLGQIELGNKRPSLEAFIKIANALDVSADLLLSDLNPSSYPAKVSYLNDKIENLPIENQKFIYTIVDTMVKEMEQK